MQDIFNKLQKKLTQKVLTIQKNDDNINLRKTQVAGNGGEKMFHVDVDKLLGKIAERRLSLSSLSEKIGISRNTLSAYMKNPDKIPYDTINRIVAVLDLNQEESVAIFFAS